MVRVQGAAVAALAATMIGDWSLETDEPVDDLARSAGLHLVEPDGTADVQVVPSGPGESGDGLLQMLLALIHAAQTEQKVSVLPAVWSLVSRHARRSKRLQSLWPCLAPPLPFLASGSCGSGMRCICQSLV